MKKMMLMATLMAGMFGAMAQQQEATKVEKRKLQRTKRSLSVSNEVRGDKNLC